MIAQAIDEDMFARRYADVFAGDQTWQNLPTPKVHSSPGISDSTILRAPVLSTV